MNISLRSITTFFLTCECLALVLSTTTAYSQETKSIPPPPVAFVVKLGMSDDGAVTSEWIEATRQRHDEEALSAILASKKRLSEEEALWAGLIKRKVSTRLAMIDSLQIPFQAVTPPDTVPILLGNLGGEDAFDQKWGALTVALWLAQEAKGDDHHLQKWVEAGPSDVLTLAQKYLPEDLKGEMPQHGRAATK